MKRKEEINKMKIGAETRRKKALKDNNKKKFHECSSKIKILEKFEILMENNNNIYLEKKGIEMLKRSEINRRNAEKEGNDRKFYEKSAEVGVLKKILGFPKNTGRKRLQKDKKDMDRLLGLVK